PDEVVRHLAERFAERAWRHRQGLPLDGHRSLWLRRAWEGAPTVLAAGRGGDPGLDAWACAVRGAGPHRPARAGRPVMGRRGGGGRRGPREHAANAGPTAEPNRPDDLARS